MHEWGAGRVCSTSSPPLLCQLWDVAREANTHRHTDSAMMWPGYTESQTAKTRYLSMNFNFF